MFEDLSVAELQTMRAAAIAQYAASLKGPYEIRGRVYNPPSPSEVREEINIISNELARRGLPDRTEVGVNEFGDPSSTASPDNLSKFLGNG